MAHFLCGYDYEPEYMAKEVEAPSLFCFSSFLVLPPLSLFVYHRIIIILFTFCFVCHHSKLEQWCTIFIKQIFILSHIFFKVEFPFKSRYFLFLAVTLRHKQSYPDGSSVTPRHKQSYPDGLSVTPWLVCYAESQTELCRWLVCYAETQTELSRWLVCYAMARLVR